MVCYLLHFVSCLQLFSVNPEPEWLLIDPAMILTDIMVLIKALLIGVVVSGLLGMGAFIASDVPGMVGDLVGDWDDRGGCGRGYAYYADENDEYSHCHDGSFEESDEGYCEHHEEYFSEEEWEDHFEECPLH